MGDGLDGMGVGIRCLRGGRWENWEAPRLRSASPGMTIFAGSKFVLGWEQGEDVAPFVATAGEGAEGFGDFGPCAEALDVCGGAVLAAKIVLEGGGDAPGPADGAAPVLQKPRGGDGGVEALEFEAGGAEGVVPTGEVAEDVVRREFRCG